MSARILIVDNDAYHGASIESLLREANYAAIAVTSVDDALGVLGPEPFAVALMSLELPSNGALALLRALRQLTPSTRCVMLTQKASVRMAVTVIKRGAVEYLARPLRPRRILALLQSLCATEHNTEINIPLGASMDHIEREVLRQTLLSTGGNKAAAARALGISRRCLYNKLASMYDESA